eukprot:CAMPEP_0184859898 /NCGR_PEP_ID=MMETSP0580-20130426/4858_1 /TAXON_ID=1118495 /ORGANISM="Dactyliosolen fragilissimus" /LENGTH=163 /DNA_ID=CAMNT_0027356765 /DNA_START=26 /DNA_END=517 /DNA_ORIENTATION=+
MAKNGKTKRLPSFITFLPIVLSLLANQASGLMIPKLQRTVSILQISKPPHYDVLQMTTKPQVSSENKEADDFENPKLQNNGVLNFLADIFDFGIAKNEQNQDSLEMERSAIKMELLEECRSDANGKNARTQRQRIEDIINKLVRIRPIDGTATSPMLRKEWNL